MEFSLEEALRSHRELLPCTSRRKVPSLTNASDFLQYYIYLYCFTCSWRSWLHPPVFPELYSVLWNRRPTARAGSTCRALLDGDYQACGSATEVGFGRG